MKRFFAITAILFLMTAAVPHEAYAQNTARHGKVTGRTVAAGLTSLLLWPGIGQVINDNEGKKVVTHAVLGLTGIFRFWSGWDALIDRQGGRWNGKI